MKFVTKTLFCKSIGLNGLKIIEEIFQKKKRTINILTHCNAGWLATIDWGTQHLQFIMHIKKAYQFMYGWMKQDLEIREQI